MYKKVAEGMNVKEKIGVNKLILSKLNKWYLYNYLSCNI